MLTGQVCIPPHHVGRLPPAELLEHVKGCAKQDMPVRPRMPQIVPPKISDPGPLQRLAPCLGIDLPNRPPPERKYVRSMAAHLFPQHDHCPCTQRHCNRSPNDATRWGRVSLHAQIMCRTPCPSRVSTQTYSTGAKHSSRASRFRST